MISTIREPQTYRADIDGLRAVAVLLVIAFHARLVPQASGGFIGVDVFFVISGYLIASIVRRELIAGDFSLVRFYERRVRRIFPALMAVILACIVTAWFAFPPLTLRELLRSAVSALGFYSNFHFLSLMGYFQPDTDILPLLHTWSLGIEEQFYLVMPLLLWLLIRRAPRYEIATLLALAIASFVYAVWLVPRAPDSAFYLPFTRVWELMAGSLLAANALPPIVTRMAREIIAAAGLALILASACLITPATPFPGLAALPAILGSSAILYAGAGAQPTMTARLLATAPLWFIGQISYSLYMWHWPILAFWRFSQWGEPDYATRLALVAATFIIAALSWRYIERPFRVRNGVLQQRGLFAAAAAGIALTIGISSLARATRGFEFRFPQLAQQRTQAPDPQDAARDCRVRAGPQTSEVCALGAANAPASFIVWGDSHAQAMAPGFARAGNALGRAGILAHQHECPPLLGLKSGAQRDNSTCAATNASVMDLIRAQKISHVFLVAHWREYARTAAPDERGFRVDPFVGLGLDNATAFARLLPQTIDAIRAAGARVTLVETVPEFPFNVATAMLRMQIFGGAPAPQSLAQHEARQRDVAEIFARLQGPSVEVLSPQAILCNNDCAFSDKEQALYSDAHHLNANGALRLAPAIETALRASGAR